MGSGFENKTICDKIIRVFGRKWFLSGLVLVALTQPFSTRQQDQRHIPHFEANPRENGESKYFFP